MISGSRLTETLEDIFGPGILREYPDEWGVVSPQDDVTGIAVATTLSPDVIRKAMALGANLVVTHHDTWPFMYEQRDHTHAMLRLNGVGHVWCHRPLDTSDFGPAATLLESLGCELVGVLDGGGRIGDLLMPAKLEECIASFNSILGEEPCRIYDAGKTISRVAAVPGGGMLTDYLRAARRHDPQLYITGETSLYLMEYAAYVGISVLIYSHNYTELRAVIELAKRVSDRLDSVPIETIEEPHY